MFSNESEFNRWFSKCIELCNGVVFAVVGGEMQKSGWPDRYVAHKIWHGWIEGKKDLRGLEPHQRYVARRLVERGVPFRVLRYVSPRCEVRGMSNAVSIEDINGEVLDVLALPETKKPDGKFGRELLRRLG